MTRSRPAILRSGLVAACDDRRLFGFGLWARQRELLAALEQGPRLHLWALGRRSGKTTLAALACLWDCTLRPRARGAHAAGRDPLRGRGGNQPGAGAPDRRRARSVVERSPALAALV